MGWWITQAADLPAAQQDHSLAVALIAALGTVLVALITIGLPLLFRQSKQADQAAAASDPRIGETVAVVSSKVEDDRRTLAQLDRHVDGIGDQVERLRWDVDDLKAWRAEQRRQHDYE